MIRRLPAATLAASLVLVLVCGLASAGGWATIVPDDPARPEPHAGEEVEYGFTVLQHGETPISWDEPTLRLENVANGEVIESIAVQSGAAGHFVARITAPEAGIWLWSVDLRDLLVDTPPVTAVVLEADGSQPALGVAEMQAAVQRTRDEASAALRDEIQPVIEELESKVGQLEVREHGLRGEIAALTAERDRLAASASSDASGSIPPLGVITLAVLAGSLAGFIMVWLGRRRPPSEIDPALPGRPVPTS